jgi:hypothetical protein
MEPVPCKRAPSQRQSYNVAINDQRPRFNSCRLSRVTREDDLAEFPCGIALDRFLDLTQDEVRGGVGLGPDVLTGPDSTACQELGLTLGTLGAQAINSLSATGVGEILALFVQEVGLGRLEPRLVEECAQPTRSTADLVVEPRRLGGRLGDSEPRTLSRAGAAKPVCPSGCPTMEP